jgi:integrase
MAARSRSSAAQPIVLPSRATAQNGAVFKPSADVWRIRALSRNMRLDYSDLPGAHHDLIPSVKATLCWFAKHRAPTTLCNLYQRFRGFFAEVSGQNGAPVTAITDVALMNFRAALRAKDQWQLSALSGAVTKWHALGYPGVDRSAVTFLRALRHVRPAAGAAVLTMDPVTGPFTDIEFEAVQKALTDAFASGELALADFLVTYIFMLTGARPVQIAALKLCDLSVTTATDGTKAYVLSVPRAKQRCSRSRAQLKHRAIIPQVGELLAHHAALVRASFAHRLDDPSQAPMFPASSRGTVTEPGLEWHRPSGYLSQRLVHALSRIAPRSERTGAALNVTPIRFRRTLGTRAAVEGHSELVIAELLDHSDTQCVGIYTAARPEIIERIDRAIAFRMAPLARAFAGTLVDGDSVSGPTITDPRFDPTMRRPVGSCGSRGCCNFLAPIACYTCTSFRPWLEGPHEAVLDHLLRERERLMSRIAARLAAVNDRTISAVAEVVLLCRERRKKIEGGTVDG